MEIKTVIAWPGARPTAADMARLLRAWLESVITGAPMADLELQTIWTGRLTITPAGDGE